MKITLNKNSLTIRANDLDSEFPEESIDAGKVDDVAANFPPGKIGTLGVSEDHSPNAMRARTSDDIKYAWMAPEEGIPGNTNRSIVRQRGWRGTSNDRAVYAMGVILVKSVRRLKRGYGYNIQFKRIKTNEESEV